MMRRMLLLFLCLESSCFANLSFEDKPAATGVGGGATSAVGSLDHLPAASACLQGLPPPQAIRRLTGSELNRSVLTLLGDSNAPQSALLFASDPRPYGLANVQQVLQVDEASALGLAAYAEAVGAYAATHAATLWPSCQTMDPACLDGAVDAFATRAYRRPLTGEERAELSGLVADATSFPAALEALVAALVQSVGLLYRLELGVADSNATFRLTPWETASLLSFTYAGGPPDDALLNAAASGSLVTPAQLEAQANRLIGSAGGRGVVERFFGQWLQTDQLPLTTRSEGTLVLSDPIKRQMLAEVSYLADQLTFDAPGRVSELFSRDQTLLGSELAAHYGATAAGLVAPSAIGRAPGVLGLGAVLAVGAQPTYASPTLRGRLVRMRLLCGSVPSPPAGVPPLAPTAASATLRQRLASHASDAGCALCHAQLDPLGFTLGAYDAVGRLRPGGIENGQEVDVSGVVAPNIGGEGVAVAVQGANGLSAVLAASATAQDCFVRHWSMVGYGRLSWSQDTCTFAAVASRARASGSGVREALVGLASTPGFRIRSAAQAARP